MTLTAPAPTSAPASDATISEVAGLDPHYMRVLDETIRDDIADGDYLGANVIVAKAGEIALRGSYGIADQATGRPTAADDVYRILSMSKGFTNALVLRAVSEGKLMLSTRVVDLIPEFVGSEPFRAARKDRINLTHLLTHRAGMPATPNPGLGRPDYADLAKTIEALGSVDVVNEPGENLNYSAAINHALLGEMARRAYGATSFSELVQEKVFAPLGMTDTHFGLPERLRDRANPLKVVTTVKGWLEPEDLECFNEMLSLPGAEMPWVGAVSTIDDVFRFTEMLRRGGRAPSGEPIISETVLDVATRNHTGDMVNDLYGMIATERRWDLPTGNMGLGFALAGEGVHARFFGPFVSPRTFGSFGAGSTLFWVDTESQMSFAFLSTGLIDEGDNVARFQKLSTIAASAVRAS